MFSKLFGTFKNIGSKLKSAFNIGRKIFGVGKRLFNTFFRQPEEPPKIDENEQRLRNTYSLEQRIIADKTPEIGDKELRDRLDKIRDIDRTNQTGFVLEPVPVAPSQIGNPFDIKLSGFM